MSELKLEAATVLYHQGSSGEVAALSEVDLFILKHEFVSIVGNNGSGKSTLLRAISGGVSLTSGRIWIDGCDVTQQSSFRRHRAIAFSHQSPLEGLALGMTVDENLTIAFLKGKRLGFGLSSRFKNEIRDSLHPLGLHIDHLLSKTVREISGGEKQLVALAMAVLQKPKILLLDEHTAALDPANQVSINQLTQRIANDLKMTILMVSHKVEDALTMGNRLVVLDRGKIIEDLEERNKSRVKPHELKQLLEQRKAITIDG